MRRMILALVALSLAASGVSLAGRDCGTTAVLNGCVGESDRVPGCQLSYSGTYTVTAEDADAERGGDVWFCLASTSSSLCPNMSAIATVTCNGGKAVSGDLNDLEDLTIRAKEGDVIRIDVALVDRRNHIQCIRLGETQFALTR